MDGPGVDSAACGVATVPAAECGVHKRRLCAVQRPRACESCHEARGACWRLCGCCMCRVHLSHGELLPVLVLTAGRRCRGSGTSSQYQWASDDPSDTQLCRIPQRSPRRTRRLLTTQAHPGGVPLGFGARDDVWTARRSPAPSPTTVGGVAAPYCHRRCRRTAPSVVASGCTPGRRAVGASTPAERHAGVAATRSVRAGATADAVRIATTATASVAGSGAGD